MNLNFFSKKKQHREEEEEEEEELQNALEHFQIKQNQKKEHR